MQRNRSWLAAFAAAGACLLSGCADCHNDVTYNPYAPTGTDPPALRQAEEYFDAPFKAMDSFDACFERAVY